MAGKIPIFEGADRVLRGAAILSIDATDSRSHRALGVVVFLIVGALLLGVVSYGVAGVAEDGFEPELFVLWTAVLFLVLAVSRAVTDITVTLVRLVRRAFREKVKTKGGDL